LIFVEQKLFTVPVDKKFWEVFNIEVKKFNKAVENMPKDKLYSLVVDPAGESIDFFFSNTHLTISFNPGAC